MVGVLLLVVVLLQREAVASSSVPVSQTFGGPAVRNLTIQNLRCGCGKRMSEELLVRESDCVDATQRRGLRVGDLQSKGEGRYPFKVKVRRDGSTGSRLLMTWNLKYIPSSKQSKIKEFRLEFTKTSGKRNDSLRRKCFAVERPAKPKVCKRQVSCEADYPKKRLRHLDVHLLYGFRNNRYKVPKFFQLKETLRRKKKKRKAISEDPQVLALMKSKNQKIRSRAKRKDRKEVQVKSCEEWASLVDIDLTADRKNQVHMVYHPANPFALKIEISLTKDQGSSHVIEQVGILANETTYNFEGLHPGNYSVLLSPFHPKYCRSIIPKRSSMVTVEGDPIPQQTQYDMSVGASLAPVCASWRPSVQAIGRVMEHGSLVQVEVTFTVPANLQAESIEVVLEDVTHGQHVVEKKFISAKARSAYFNISGHSNQTFKAMVRPSGCRDCRDYELYRDICNPAYHLSNIFTVANEPTTTSLSTAQGGDTSSTNREDGAKPSVAVTESEKRSSAQAPASLESDPQPTLKPLTTVLTVSAVLIAVVTAVVICWYMIDRPNRRLRRQTCGEAETQADVEGGRQDAGQSLLGSGNDDTQVKQIASRPIQETAKPYTTRLIRDTDSSFSSNPRANESAPNCDSSHLPTGGYRRQVALTGSNYVKQMLAENEYANRTLVKQPFTALDTTEVKRTISPTSVASVDRVVSGEDPRAVFGCANGNLNSRRIAVEESWPSGLNVT